MGALSEALSGDTTQSRGLEEFKSQAAARREERLRELKLNALLINNQNTNNILPKQSVNYFDNKNDNLIGKGQKAFASIMSHELSKNPYEEGPNITIGDIAQFAPYMTPGVGDVADAEETRQNLMAGNYGQAALSGIGLLPFVPGITKPLSDFMNKSNIFNSIDDIKQAVDLSSKPVFVRWSSSIDHDLSPDSFSRDYAAGGQHSGLSAVPIDAQMSKSDLAKYINEYGFLRIKDPSIKPRFYEADIVGIDSDGYPSIRPTKYLGGLSDELLSGVDNGLWEKLDLEEKINDGESRLKKISDPIARKIVQKNVDNYKKQLNELGK